MLLAKLFDLPIPVSLPPFRYMSASVTRPNDTSAYAAGDTFADSTSTPTPGGFTLAVNVADRIPNVLAVSQPLLPAPLVAASSFPGAGGLINDAIVVASASTAYQGELWLFERAVTAVNDNAAFVISDAEALALIGVVPFLVNDTTSNNAISYIGGLNIGFACDPGSIRFLIKLMNAPTPAASEILSVRLKFQSLRGI